MTAIYKRFTFVSNSVLLVLLILITQMAKGAPENTRTSITQVRKLVEAANSLPIEYRADIQLNAIEPAKAGRGPWVQSVLEQLFRDAGTAQFQYKQKDVTNDNFARS